MFGIKAWSTIWSRIARIQITQLNICMQELHSRRSHSRETSGVLSGVQDPNLKLSLRKERKTTIGQLTCGGVRRMDTANFLVNSISTAPEQ